MAYGGTFCNNGLNLVLQRAYADSVTEISLFKVGTGTTTPTATDTDLESAVMIWGSETKAFQSGYPKFDSTNKRTTIRGFLSANECNGDLLTEFGTFNSGGTMATRHTHIAKSKSDTDEFYYVEIIDNEGA